MNPSVINDTRTVVWTFSETVKDTYCIYLNGHLHAENLDIESFLVLYRKLRG